MERKVPKAQQLSILMVKEARKEMEKLKDERSTNLYMEGLPLSINETALAALAVPYRIMSSRMFQTRLSDPPRLIAFVRSVSFLFYLRSKLRPAVG